MRIYLKNDSSVQVTSIYCGEVGTGCTIGENVVNDGKIGNKVTVGTETKIAGNATVGNEAVISEHCEIGNYSVVDEGAKLARNVKLQQKVFIGKKVRVGHSVEIGESAIIYEPISVRRMWNFTGGFASTSKSLSIGIPSGMKIQTGEIVIGAPYTYQFYGHAERKPDEKSQE